MEIDLEGWFHETSRAKLTELIEKHAVESVIEIGSFVGKSTAFFANKVETVYAIDPWVMWKEGSTNGEASKFGDDFFDQFIFNMKELGFMPHIRPIRSTSADACKKFPDLRADLVYIDGAHDYESVRNDIQLWLPRANKIICGDDYDENWPDVKRAVDEFFPNVNIEGNLWYAEILNPHP